MGGYEVQLIVVSTVVLLGYIAAAFFRVNAPRGQDNKRDSRMRSRQNRANAGYKYRSKNYIMTSYEGECFRRLERIAGSKYYIFPQVQLSSLLDHRAQGQNWRIALSKIQRKSIDFVLVNRETLKTAYAIELDDRTHDKLDRIERDAFVNAVLNESGMPIVRLRNIKSMEDNEIAELIKASNNF